MTDTELLLHDRERQLAYIRGHPENTLARASYGETKTPQLITGACLGRKGRRAMVAAG